MANEPGEFGRLLRSLRSRALLSQEALAERAGLSVRSIRELERGRVEQPHASTLELLARALHMTDEERDRLAAAASDSNRRGPATALPPPVELIGRDAELGALPDFVGRLGPAQPLVLSGRPGVGKTALAVALARETGAASFPDGIVFLPLRGMSAPLPIDAALRSLLRALDVDAPAGASIEDLEANARFHYSTRRMLLVLDDAANEGQVRPLLVGGAAARVIVTSRFHLAGLDSAKLFVVHSLDRRDSIELLRRAGARGEGEAAYEAVAQACGDLPLALRIAASKLAARDKWSVTDLATKLGVQQRLDALTAGDRDVRSSIRLSVDALTPAGRSALLCMASLGIPVVPDWLAAGAAGMSMAEFATASDELVDASLVDSLGFAGADSERLRLHDLIRVYAAEQARMTSERGSDDDLDRDALRRAIRALLVVLVAADVRADALGFLPCGPLWRTSRDALEIDVSPVGHDERLDEAYSAALVVIQRACDRDLAAVAWPLATAMASIQDRKGLLADLEQTHALLMSALADDDDRIGLATIVVGVAGLELARGDAQDALHTYERAASLAADLGYKSAQLWARAGVGTAMHYAQRSAEARAILQEVRSLALGALAPDALWQSSLTLAQLLLGEGKPAEALHCLDEAEAAPTGTPPPHWLASFRFEAGRCHLELGDLAGAERALEDAVQVFREVESPVWEAAALRQVGRLHERREEYSTALQTFTECLAVFESIGDLRWAGWVLGDIAELHLKAGERADALRRLTEGRDRLAAIDDRRGLSRLERIEESAG